MRPPWWRQPCERKTEMDESDFTAGIDRLLGNYSKVSQGLVRELRAAFDTWTAHDWDALVGEVLATVKFNPRLAHFHEAAPRVNRDNIPSGSSQGCGLCRCGWIQRYVLLGSNRLPYSEVYPCPCHPRPPHPTHDGGERVAVTFAQFLARHQEINAANRERITSREDTSAQCPQRSDARDSEPAPAIPHQAESASPTIPSDW